jgi:hypothetical protein
MVNELINLYQQDKSLMCPEKFLFESLTDKISVAYVTHYIDETDTKKLQPCNVGGVLGFGRAEQFCTPSVHMLSCLYSTPGDSLA